RRRRWPSKHSLHASGDLMSLKCKTLFITGARGIGLAIALRAAQDGANIAIEAKTETPHPKLEDVHSAGGGDRTGPRPGSAAAGIGVESRNGHSLPTCRASVNHMLAFRDNDEDADATAANAQALSY